MKRTPLRRKTKLRRQKKTPIAKLKREAEAIWKRIVLKLHPICEGCEMVNGVVVPCPNKAEVAHHMIRRSKSLNTFVAISNGLSLCFRCHSRIHLADDKLIEAQIVLRRGEGWLNELVAMSKQIVHANRYWWELVIEGLKGYEDTKA